MKKKQQKQSGNYIIGKLQNLYCSCQSEVSAFLFFNYNSIIFKNTYHNLSNIFNHFSKQSLENSKILADILLLSNTLPLYQNSQKMPLTGLWFFHCENNQDILKSSELFVKELIKKYDETISICKIKKISKKLCSLKTSNEKILEIIKSLL